eukprot:gene12284-biopygen6336
MVFDGPVAKKGCRGSDSDRSKMKERFSRTGPGKKLHAAGRVHAVRRRVKRRAAPCAPCAVCKAPCASPCDAVWRRVAPCGAVWRRVRRVRPHTGYVGVYTPARVYKLIRA